MSGAIHEIFCENVEVSIAQLKRSRVHSRSLSKAGLVVQLVRMPPCHGGGRGFESRPDRKRPCFTQVERGFCTFEELRWGALLDCSTVALP